MHETTQGPPAAPPLVKFLYSFGYIGIALVDRVMAMCLMAYYVPTEGNKEGMPLLVATMVFGSIMFFGRAADTIIDPAIAFLSDRCRSKRGRRMPFMLYGGLPLAASMTLLFFQPTPGQSTANAIYLAFMLSSFFFFFSFYVCPYLGLLPEIAHTEKERIDLTSMQGLFMLIGTMVGGASFLLVGTSLGYRGMAVIMGVIALITLYAPVVAVDEKKYCNAEPSSMGLVSTIVQTLRNTPFVIYLVGNLSFWFGFNIISTCVNYYTTTLLGLKEIHTALFMTTALVSALIFIFPINLMMKRIGKRNTMMFSLFLFMLLLPLIYVLGLPSVPIPPMVFGYGLMALIGLPLANLFVVPNALVADLTDYDFKLTGVRREAIYFGSQGLFLKFILGLSALLNTFLFKQFGNSVTETLGIRLTGPVGGFFALVGLVAFMFYPKDLDAHAEKVLAARSKG